MPLDLTKDIVIRWDNPEPAQAALLAQAGIAPIPAAEFQTLPIADLSAAKPGAIVAATGGLWPGIRRPATVPGRGDETASASREPWVDASGYQIGYLRALYPNRPPVLGYLPEKLDDRAVPFDSLELALIEAWTAGGNYLLAFEPHYKTALLRNDPKAMAAWQQLGRTARWLREHIAMFRQPSIPIVTALVEPGEETAEIANLLYRRNVSPAFAPVSAPPRPDPERRLALVAVNIRPPTAEQAKRILAHAEAGATVIVAAAPDGQWWRGAALKKIRSEPDREFHSLGKGQVVVYPEPIADPSEFALDVIDILTHRKRAVRIWNAPAVIAVATAAPRGGERLLHLINYGSPIDNDVQARVQGHFNKAELLRPDASPMPLKPARRGTMTEVQVPALKRLAVIRFS